MHVISGKRKHSMSNDYLPLIRTTEEGERMLIAAVIATAVWDALGQGMTGRNREGLMDSAWQYLESSMFQQDLELGWEQVSAVVWRRMGLESTS